MDIVSAENQVIQAYQTLTENRLITQCSGSVSARTDSGFIITPKTCEIGQMDSTKLIAVEINAPSIAHTDETALHLAVYQEIKEAGAVVYTQQEFASVAGAMGLDALNLTAEHPLLGSRIAIIGDPGAGSRTLAHKTAATLKKSQGKALILKNRGVICYGKDAVEAAGFAAAIETAARDFLNQAYMKRRKENKFDELEMYVTILNEYAGHPANIAYGSFKRIFNASRNRTGFTLYDDEQRIKIAFDHTSKKYPEETKMYNTIFKACPHINHIIINNSKPVSAVVSLEAPIRPILADFAEWAGARVRMAWEDPRKTARVLKRVSAVQLLNIGIMCCGRTMAEAEEISFSVEKNSRAYLYAWVFGGPKALSRRKAAELRREFFKKKKKM